MWCKLQVETPSDYTFSLFWAELSRLLGKKKSLLLRIVGLEPETPGSVVQRFNHLATKQPPVQDTRDSKVRVPNLGRFLIWDKVIFQGTLSYILTVYTAHTQHHLRYLHTKCLAREDSGNPFADIEVL